MLFAALNFTAVDALYDGEQYSACKTELLKMRTQAATAQEEAEVLWRLSRAALGMGDDLDKKDKDGRFAAYEEGEEYANLSIARYPNAFAYHWKASNIGRWGQTKGPLNSLGKAKGMLEDLTMVVNDFNIDDYTETWYVLFTLQRTLSPSGTTKDRLYASCHGYSRFINSILTLQKFAGELWAELERQQTRQGTAKMTSWNMFRT